MFTSQTEGTDTEAHRFWAVSSKMNMEFKMVKDAPNLTSSYMTLC
jgi:hypothetical protein